MPRRRIRQKRKKKKRGGGGEEKRDARNQTAFVGFKETTLERADFAPQLSMFVTAEKEREMFIIFFLSIFCQLLSPRF